MKEALVYPDLTVKIVDSEIPKPGPDEVLIKVWSKSFHSSATFKRY